MIRRVALVWVCCALALASCSKQKQPSTLPPLPSASASPSASLTPPKPADAKAAIVALAKAYYVERNTAVRTGDTRALRALSLPGCSCLKFADHIDADWRRGTVPVPNFYVVTQVIHPILDSPTVGYVTAIYRTSAYRVVGKSGRVIVDIPADPTLEGATVECHEVAGGWRVAEIVVN